MKHPIVFCISIFCAAVTTAAEIDFAHEVVPILRQHCAKCHADKEAKGGFSINSRSTFIDGGAEPGDVESSRFLELVRSSDVDDQMPPKELKRVSKKEIATLESWVKANMPWTGGFSFAAESYVPPLRPRQVELPPAIDSRSNPIDRIIDNYLRSKNQPIPSRVDDATFLRRVHLDLNGLLPTAKEATEYVRDPSPSKRAALVDRLLENKSAYTEHWLTFWNDWLRNDYAGTGFITGGRRQISGWLYSALMTNKPYNEFAAELIAPKSDQSRGFIDGIKWRGTVSAGQSNEIQFAQSVAQAFLGINMKCASCHDSFIDDWKLNDAYSLAAIYSASPLEIHRCDKPTGQTATAAWIFPELGNIDATANREQRLAQLAGLMTQKQNGRFARTIVNRLWAQLMGRGIVHPLDAMHTRPWNEDLLDFLANDFVARGYDLKATIKLIAMSEAYSAQSDFRQGEDDASDYLYAGPKAKRLTAEQFVDAAWQITGQAPKRIDAPVLRGDFESGDDKDTASIEIVGDWIWAEPIDGQDVPGKEEIIARTVVDISGDVLAAVAVATCDNEFELFVANKLVASSNEWTDPQAILLTNVLKKGKNVITVIARNTAPSPAGIFFQAHVTLKNKQTVMIKTDDSWQVTRKRPKNLVRNGRLGKLVGPWEKSVAQQKLGVYGNAVDDKAKRILAGSVVDLMVRASLLKSDFFMRSMGRPNRDQIVTSRPAGLTTLEAIDLSNHETLSNWVDAGAADLVNQFSDPEKLTDHLFLSMLTRRPSSDEKRLIVNALGRKMTEQSVQDVLWAIFVMPEFMVIR